MKVLQGEAYQGNRYSVELPHLIERTPKQPKSVCVYMYSAYIDYFMYIAVLPAYTYVSGCEKSWNWSNSCEQPCGCWELRLGPLEKQSVIITAEPSLQPSKSSSFKSNCFIVYVL